MRDIKFRTWNKDLNANGGMVWNVAVLNGKYFEPYYMETRNYPLMQYTGLRDKNGVEIYEGDVVLYKYASYKDISKVVYNTENASFIMIAIKEDDNKSMAKFKEGRKHNFVEGCVNGYDYVKVIGNIYENPELLEGNTNET